MASAVPALKLWISTPWRLANANGRFRWVGPALGTSPRSSLLGCAAIGLGGGRLGAIGRSGGPGDAVGLILGQRRQQRPIELAQEAHGVVGRLTLEILNVAVLRVGLEARVLGVAGGR